MYDITPSLTIYPTTGADQYEYELYDLSNSDLIESTSSSLETISIPTLQYDNSYSWRVRAHNAAGWGPWSNLWIFNMIETVIPDGALASQSDPDEIEVPNGRDFQAAYFYKDNENLKIIITFYGDYTFFEDNLIYFMIAADTTIGEIPEIRIRCWQTYVSAEVNPSGEVLYYGAPVIEGNKYTLTFPYDAVFGGCSTIYPWIISYPAPGETFDRTAQFTVNWPKETEITVNCNPNMVDISENQIITISGQLTLKDQTTPITNMPIALSYKAVEDSTFEPIECSLTTDTNGLFSFEWAVPQGTPQGYYIIKATFIGAIGYAPSTAATSNQMNLFVVPEYLFGGLISIAACFAALMCFKKLQRNPITK